MKKYLKSGFMPALALLGGLSLLIGCAEEEELNLTTYPGSSVSVTTSGDSGNSSEIKIEATYDEAGQLVLSSPLRRTWTVSLATPATEDVTLQIEPLTVNIPEDKVEISTREVTIPAGFVSAEVEVGIKNDDYSFAAEELKPQVYELGLRVVGNMQSEGKAVVNKISYNTVCSLAGEKGNSVSFTRLYKDGAIVGGDALSYTFKMVLDRPVKSDLKVHFDMEGVADEFMGNVTFSPSADITIPAGEVESGDITWGISNDFLLANPEEETFNLFLKPVIEASEFVSLSPEAGEIAVEVRKVTHSLELATGVLSNWERLERDGWGIELGDGFSGNGTNIVDNTVLSYVSYVESEGSQFEIVMDMQKEQAITGIQWLSRGRWGYIYYSPVKMEILVSSDKTQWESLGTVDELQEQQERLYFNLLVPSTARYIKYIGTVDSNLGSTEITEIYVYGPKE
jgi:F5/8 type C domain.